MHLGRHTSTHSHSSESRRGELSVRLIRVCLDGMVFSTHIRDKTELYLLFWYYMCVDIVQAYH